MAGGRLTPARYAAHALGLPLLLAAFGAGVAGFLVLAGGGSSGAPHA